MIKRPNAWSERLSEPDFGGAAGMLVSQSVESLNVLLHSSTFSGDAHGRQHTHGAGPVRRGNSNHSLAGFEALSVHTPTSLGAAAWIGDHLQVILSSQSLIDSHCSLLADRSPSDCTATT